MKSLPFFLTLSALLVISTSAVCQTNGKIYGSIKDGGQQPVIDAATISLLKAKDSSLIKASLTDKTGNFSFENLQPGNYLVMATSVGHAKKYSAPVMLSEGKEISTGVLQLVAIPKTLKEVSVNTTKPFIERKIDKTVLNVDALISNAGTTVMEVLEKAPGVSVDKDGKVSLKGKQNVIIMMDGRPAYLSGQQLADLLKNMPSSAIEQIEIMTNPSAKYDASGNAGIINIRTKKNVVKGFNGSASTSLIQGIRTKSSSSINMNYRKNKLNLFGNYSNSLWNGLEDLSIHRNFRDANGQLSTIFDQNSYMRNNSSSHNLKVGMDFYTSKKTTLGAVVSGFVNPRNNRGDNTTLLKNGVGRIDSILFATNKSTQKSNNLGVNLNFRHQFDSTGKEITTDLDYLKYDQTSDQLFTNNYLNADMSKRRSSSLLKGTLPASVKIYSGKLDYSMPFKKSGKLEAGLKSSYVNTDNDAQYQNDLGTGWVTDLGKTNHFVYKENINAAYLNVNRQIRKLGIQAGLRVENTNAQGHQLGNSTRRDSSFKRNYTNLFPTVFVSYDHNKKNTFSVNFGRRIDRPAYQDLNPFYYFLDEYTYQVGNTLLKPQFTNSVELSHTYKGFLTTTINYSHTDDVFTEVLDQVTAERKTFVSKDNIATKRNIGLAISAYTPITKYWTTNIYFNVVNDKYNGALKGDILDVTGTKFMSNINNQFKFKKGWSAELSGFYRSKGIEGQIVANEMWAVNSGVSKQMLKTKGTIKLSVRDVFNSQKFSGYVKYRDIDVSILSKNETRRASLTFTYRFGKPIKDQKTRKVGGAGDEQNRVKTGS